MFNLIILAILAAVIISKLLNILGRNDKDVFDDKNNIDPFIEQLRKTNNRFQDGYKGPVDIEIVSALEAGLSQNLREIFDKIRQYKKSFIADTFIEGAKGAFKMILEAFYNNDKDTLKNLLDENVYNSFAINMLDINRSNPDKVKKPIIVGVKIEILEASLIEKVATIKVKITSDQMDMIKNDTADPISSGHTKTITHTDIWSFRSNLDKDKVWFLSAIHASD